MTEEMRALCAGVHVLDVLVRPVEAIPEGQGGELVEEIRVTAAGSAGGTALVLARLGAKVKSAGAIGTDAAGDMLLALARAGRRGHRAAGATRRRPDLRERPAHPPERRAARLPRGRRQRQLRTRRPAGGRDRGRHAPAPRRTGVHGRRGGRAAARFGCAAAAMVAQRLGTDHGDYDLAAVEKLA
jgi:sugar/nucleoside kinase (ribokinase family)